MTEAQPLYGPPQPQPRNGLGTTALVLGIVGLALAWIPIIGYVALILGIVGVVLGAVGYRKTRKGQADNPKVAIWGTVLSALTIALSILFFAVLLNVASDASNDLEKWTECTDKISLDDPNYAAKTQACDDKYLNN
jgi:drug/metabolite transporter (DMT)-like permease